jgi:hypothetical protein
MLSLNSVDFSKAHWQHSWFLLAPADFFLFPKVKEQLNGASLTLETVKFA